MRRHCWIEVIFFSLDVPPDRLAGLGSALSADEGARAERFRAERDRHRFIAARGMLRELLGERSRERPDLLRFGYGGFGKPFLEGSPDARPLEFNLSHSEEMAVLAITTGRPVGVDIEKVRADLDPFEIGSGVLTRGEESFLRGLPPRERTPAFFSIWARKEAFMKARGEGFSMDPSGFEALWERGRTARTIAASGDDRPSLDRWVLHDVSWCPEFSAAVAVEGRSIRLHRAGEKVFRGWIQ